MPVRLRCLPLRGEAPRLPDLLDSCIARVLDRLRAEKPDFGRDLVDASDLPAYANGQRYVSKGGRERERFSDPDASWGHRSAVSTRKGGGFYGYKVHAAACARTDLPVAWQVETARAHESSFATALLDAAKDRGFAAETTALDMGYDTEAIHGACEARGSRPIIPLKQTPASRPGRRTRPSASTGRGPSPGPIRRVARPSGVARPLSASPARAGSRRIACIPSCPESRSAGSRSTGAVAP